jgi:hypothetical protein
MMWMRTSLMTMLTAVVLLTAGRCYPRLERSTAIFEGYFRALKSSEVSINPVERFVFSLILANTKTHEREKNCANART